jgi:long-chain acyl-CoA synthetase
MAVRAILDAFADIAEGARLASWLPLSNPFQRIINLCAMARGAQTYYVSDPREVMRHLPAIRPQVFIGVPRFFEKFYAAAMAQLAAHGRWRERIARWAIDIGDRRARLLREGQAVPARLGLGHRLADAVVLRHIRNAFGGELRYLVSGSAAMPPWLLERLHAMGLLVLEAYGLSECIVPVAANRPGAYRFGSVGRLMLGNEARLAPDGELLLRSGGVFERYLGAADDANSVDDEGWLPTGDYATIDADGFVSLLGRKSEVFKTSTGRRVAPQVVEAALKAVPGVEHAAVFGAGRPNLLAVVTLSPEAPASVANLRSAVPGALVCLPDYLRPAGLVLSRRPFAIESGELTGNLKLRRQVVGDRFAAALGALAALVDGRTGQPDVATEFEPGVDLLLL